MKTGSKDRLFHLFTAHAADALTAEEQLELQETLRRAADARQLWFVHQDVEMGLQAQLLARPDAKAGPPSAKAMGPSWRLLAAAAAGLALGLFSASLVFGYVVPSWQTRVELFSDGFESGPAPQAKEMPLDEGYWSGDYTEITGPMGEVKPLVGNQMLRFLRADHEGEHLPDSYSSDSFRLLDVRPYKREFADGTAVVRLSAFFNGEVSAVNGPFSCVLMIYALDEALVAERRSGTYAGSIRRRMLANSSSTRIRLDHDPATWQQASNELRLPPGTDYLMIQVGMANDSQDASKRKDAFAVHFVDRVQLVLAHLPEVTLP